MSIQAEAVIDALRGVNDPDLGKDIVSLNFVEDLRISENNISFTVMLTTPACPMKEVIRNDCLRAIKTAVPGVGRIDIKFDSRVRQDSAIKEKLSIPVKNIIAVSSGKGGVGKTTLTVHIAKELAAFGSKVAILDADIYGPNIPRILRIDETPREQNDKLVPPVKYGMQVMSMGFLIPPDQALVWRGPMLHGAINQLFSTVAWGEADYLLVDLPPGTGDVQLSLAQLTPITGGIIVSTSHAMSTDDARRGIDAFKRLNVPLLGLVENLSGPVFGAGAVEGLSREMSIPYLGSIPMEAEIAEHVYLHGERERGASPGLDAIRSLATTIAAHISVLQHQN